MKGPGMCCAFVHNHQDHLGVTPLVTDSAANQVGSITYKPYGETRTPPTPCVPDKSAAI